LPGDMLATLFTGLAAFTFLFFSFFLFRYGLERTRHALAHRRTGRGGEALSEGMAS